MQAMVPCARHFTSMYRLAKSSCEHPYKKNVPVTMNGDWDVFPFTGYCDHLVDDIDIRLFRDWKHSIMPIDGEDTPIAMGETP